MAKAKTEEVKVEEGIERFDVINGYVLENPDKLDRVIHGEVKRAGAAEGGLGEEADPNLVLAHYDKLAGYITKDIGSDKRVKIKTGSFWDFKRKAPKATPDVRYLFRVGGEDIEVGDPSELASAVTTVNIALEEKEQKSRERRERAKRKSLIKGE